MEIEDVIVDDLILVHHYEQIDSLVGNKVVSLITNSDVVSVLNLSLFHTEINF